MTTAPAVTAPVTDPDDAVHAALERLHDTRFPGISDLSRWLFAAAHAGDGMEAHTVDDTDGDWLEFRTAFAHYAEFDRDQLCLVLGWPVEMDDVEFVDQLHNLRRVQTEHRRLQPLAEWLTARVAIGSGDPVAEFRSQLGVELLRASVELLTVAQLIEMIDAAARHLTVTTGEVLQPGSAAVLAQVLRPALLRRLARHAEHPPTKAAVSREHVARILAVALHADCPPGDEQHAAAAHSLDALRLVDALAAKGLDVQYAGEQR
jgi:hypothetical protein